MLLNHITKTINSILSWIGGHLILLWNNIQFSYYKYEANQLHNLTGKRYFVIPNGNSLKVVDNDYVKLYNKAASKLNYKKINIMDLLQSCYYCTSTGTTSNRKPAKRNI